MRRRSRRARREPWCTSSRARGGLSRTVSDGTNTVTPRNQRGTAILIVQLQLDDDLSILHSRLPPKSTPSATLHLSPPHAHAHFAPSPAPPAYSTDSSAIKSKNQNRSRTASATKSNTTANGSSSATPKSPKSKDFATQTPSSNGDEAKHASKSSPQKPSESKDKSANPVAKYEREVGKTATGFAVARPKSVMSARTNRTHRSKWGDDDAEPMGDVHKRKWLEVGRLR